MLDGSVRDLEGIAGMPMPAYFRHVHPTPIGNVMLTGINIPVRIGNATVMPGDLVFGDREGVYFIPPALVQEVLDRADETHIHDEWTKKKFDEGTSGPVGEGTGVLHLTTTQSRWAGFLGITLAAGAAMLPSTRVHGQASPARAAVSGAAGRAAPPPSRHPRYFLFRGRPTVVITSGEHYGAVLNLDFDYRRYFCTLKADGLNGTRIFSGTYVETGGNFGIAANTLDPAKGRFISPWARSTTDGYADGGAKFELARFDDALRHAAARRPQGAAARGIIVELVLFCPLYEDSMWAVSPMNPVNNVNGLPPIRREDVLTLDRSGPLLAVQEAVASRLVAAVRRLRQCLHRRSATSHTRRGCRDWQRDRRRWWPIRWRSYRSRPSSTQSVSTQVSVVDPHPAISIFNFHYAAARHDRLERAPRAPDRRQRDRPRSTRIGLPPHRGLGLHPAGRRPLQQPRLLVHGGPRGRGVRRADAAGWRRRPLPAAARRPAPVHRPLRPRELRPAPQLVVGSVPDSGSVQVLAQGEDAFGVYLRRQRP